MKWSVIQNDVDNMKISKGLLSLIVPKLQLITVSDRNFHQRLLLGLLKYHYLCLKRQHIFKYSLGCAENNLRTIRKSHLSESQENVSK